MKRDAFSQSRYKIWLPTSHHKLAAEGRAADAPDFKSDRAHTTTNMLKMVSVVASDTAPDAHRLFHTTQKCAVLHGLCSGNQALLFHLRKSKNPSPFQATNLRPSRTMPCHSAGARKFAEEYGRRSLRHTLRKWRRGNRKECLSCPAAPRPPSTCQTWQKLQIELPSWELLSSMPQSRMQPAIPSTESNTRNGKPCMKHWAALSRFIRKVERQPFREACGAISEERRAQPNTVWTCFEPLPEE